MGASPPIYINLSAWLKNHAVASSLVILFCSIFLRVLIAWRMDPSDLLRLYPDAGTYLAPAHSLLERGAFLDSNGNPMVDRTPGYPAFFALLMFVVGTDLRMDLIAQAIVLSLGVLVLYWFMRRIVPPVIAFMGGLLAAFSPWGAVLAGLPLSEGTFLFLLALILLAMKLTDGAYNLSAVALGGVIVGLLTGTAVLVRPLWPLVILIPAAFFLCYGPKRKGAWVLLIATLVCAVAPVAVWKERNQTEAHFNGLSDIPGKTVWRYLAARVRAEVDGQDRHMLATTATQEDQNWALSVPVEEADNERWRRAKAVFREHPFVTVYSFARSAAEHVVHPSPDVLTPAKLNFSGDYLVMALLWGALLVLACLGWLCVTDPSWHDGEIDRRWVLTLLVISLVLTASSGISFGQGSRLRAPLELVVPLLAAVGLACVVRLLYAALIPTRAAQSSNLSDF